MGIRRALVPLLLAAVVLHSPVSAHSGPAARCGTAVRMAEGKAAPLAKRRATAAPVRTLETSRFRIHYTLAGTDQAKLGEGDDRLRAVRDSLYAALGPSADAAVHARLDALGAPHPRYVTAAAGFLEEAWRYYVDSLGMRAPAIRAPSPYYGAAAAAGKYQVDIADLGNAWPARRSVPLYGITLAPADGGMVIENDFLYLASLGPDGAPAGRPVTSVLDDRVLRDYSREWEMGLKVTCFHEFYHAVQFAYTPGAGAGDFHVWYETGATAMEERKAPEADDYLQYVRDLFRLLGSAGMLGYPEAHENLPYGNALYHLFLDAELGSGFDAAIWEDLASNGNRLPAALARAFASRRLDPRESHARYAAWLAVAGTAARPAVGPVHPDASRWPRLGGPPADAARIADLGSLPPLSVKAVTLSGTRGTGLGLFLRDPSLRAVMVRFRGDSAAVAFPAGASLALDGGPSAPDTLLLLVANGSFDRAGSAALGPRTSRRDTAAYPYPNPLDRSAGFVLFSRLDRAATVAILGERGRPVRALAFPPDSSAWGWDLADGRGRKVPPGLYWYRVDGGRPAPLYVR